ncbi:MAG: adenylyl-sulfate kinase [Methanosarcinales archaeon]
MTWSLWFTGLPGSGKSAIALKTRELLEKDGIKVKILGLDEIRKIITPNPRYTEEERDIVYASLAYMAKLVYDCKVNVIIDATANKQKYRALARQLIPNFAEVYIKCPLEVCIQRERYRKDKFAPKDIYKKSKEKNATVPGVNVVYETPENAEIIVESDKLNIEECAEKIVLEIGKIFD